jgi:Protein of unknown function (DUF4233)
MAGREAREPGRPGDVRGRSPVRRLYATVLGMEAIVIALAIPVAITIEHVHAGLAGLIGGVAAVAAVTLAAAAARGSRTAVIGGTVLQALLIVAGVEVPAMLILGAVFAALWAASAWLGRRIGPAA